MGCKPSKSVAPLQGAVDSGSEAVQGTIGGAAAKAQQGIGAANSAVASGQRTVQQGKQQATEVVQQAKQAVGSATGAAQQAAGSAMGSAQQAAGAAVGAGQAAVAGTQAAAAQGVQSVTAAGSAAGAAAGATAASGLRQFSSRGNLARVESKRLFNQADAAAAAAASPISTSVGRHQKRGSVTKAHGMSFTEAKRPVEEVISIRAESMMRTATKEQLKEIEDDIKQNAKSVPDRVYEAVNDGVPAVLALMRSDPQSQEMQQWCCDALASLTAGDEEARAEVAKENGLDDVVEAMVNFPGAASVQTKACWAIANLAASFSAELGELGAVEAIVTAMKLVAEYELQTVSIRALTTLTALPANMQRAVDAGALANVAAVVAAHESDGQLHYRCSMLMEKLKAAGATESAPAPAAAAEDAAGAGSGAGSAAAAGMRRIESKRIFGGDAAEKPRTTSVGRKQRRGSVTKSHGMSFTELKLPADQVISLAVQNTIDEAPETEDVEAKAADEAKEQRVEQQVLAAAQEGPAAVVALMRSDPDSPQLQWWCHDAIASLSAGQADNRKLFADEGACELVVQAMKQFEDNVTLQLKASWAVANLAADYAEKLGEAGAAECVTRNLSLEDPQLQQVAVRALNNLSTHPANAKRAAAAGAADAVERVLDDNSANGELHYRVHQLLPVLREYEEDDNETLETIVPEGYDQV